jgi:hypothetical protein
MMGKIPDKDLTQRAIEAFEHSLEDYGDVYQALADYDKGKPVKFQRKTNDCLSIVIKERSRLGLSPLPNLSWVYEKYPTVESHPSNLVAELLERHCKRREGAIEHGDLLCLRMGKEANLGMAFIQNNDEWDNSKNGELWGKVGNVMWVVYADENGAAYEPLHRRIIRCVESVWYLG